MKVIRIHLKKINKRLFSAIHFLTRIPSGRSIFRNSVKDHASTLENLENAHEFGDRNTAAKPPDLTPAGGDVGG